MCVCVCVTIVHIHTYSCVCVCDYCTLCVCVCVCDYCTYSCVCVCDYCTLCVCVCEVARYNALAQNIQSQHTQIHNMVLVKAAPEIMHLLEMLVDKMPNNVANLIVEVSVPIGWLEEA